MCQQDSTESGCGRCTPTSGPFGEVLSICVTNQSLRSPVGGAGRNSLDDHAARTPNARFVTDDKGSLGVGGAVQPELVERLSASQPASRSNPNTPNSRRRLRVVSTGFWEGEA